MIKKIFCLALALGVFAPACCLDASAAAGKVAAPYLQLPLSTRATGMGEAFTGVSDDDAALYYNPAGMSQMDSTLASFMHLQGFGGINYEYLGLITSLENLGVDVWGSVGLSYELIGIDPIQRTQADISGNYDQAYADRNFTYTAGGTLFGLSYAWQATKLFSLGATIKMINQKVDDAEGWGYAADLALFTKPEGIPGLGVGFVVENVGSSPDATAPLPMSLRAGAGYTFKHIFSTEERPVDKLLVSADLVFPIVPIDSPTRVNAGLEYSRWFSGNQLAALRLGYRFPTDLGALASMTAGMGYAMEFPGTMISIDYAFVPYGDLGVSHRVSLTGNFGLKKPSSPILSEAEKFGPPKGLKAVGGDKRVALNWTASKSKVVGYNVYMSYNPAKGQWFKLNKTPVTGVSIGSGGLYNNYNYYFAVTAVQDGSSGKESEKSEPVMIMPHP
jgi:hypothetical protein